MKIYSSLQLVAVLVLFLISNNSFAQTRADYYSNLDKSQIKTGVLYDIAKSHTDIAKYTGKTNSPQLTNASWKQIYHEFSVASLSNTLPEINTLISKNNEYVKNNIYPIYLLDYQYNTIRNNAFDKGILTIQNNAIVQAKNVSPYEQNNVFVASTISERTYSNLNIQFIIPDNFIFQNYNSKIDYFLVDFNDGNGSIKLKSNEIYTAKYDSEGEKNITLTAYYSDNSTLSTKFKIKVKDTGMPTPDQDWTTFTAEIAYNGSYATGEVAIFYGAGHTTLTEPVIIVDGFDPGDTRPVSGLYEICNQQNMVDSLRAKGLDLILLNSYDGAGYIQKNAMMFVHLLDTINQIMTTDGTMLPANQVVVIGPSMGGLITRYGITYMENNHIPTNVRNWLSFDSPQKGANIPLGVQHWLRFFAEVAESEGAIEGKAALITPAAKQMLLYHYTATSGNSANPNSLMTQFYNEINTMGFPHTRRSAISNGSGYGATQGFNPANMVVYFHYRSFKVDLDGNIWAVPDHTNTRIFNGLYDTALPFDEVNENIYVNNTYPYDGAPGGNIGTFKVLDETDPGYGDIIAYYDNHAFIPTISAFALSNTNDPLFDIDANLASVTTPFDAIYYPHENQEHMFIGEESVQWFVHEVYNFPPVFTSTPQTITNEDELFTYVLTASDENEWNVLNFSAENIPSWLTFDATTSTLSGTPTNDNVGIFNIKLKVTDSLKSTYQEFSIEVKNTNDAPVVSNELIDQVIEADYSSLSYTFSSNSFTDVDANDSLSYSMQISEGSLNSSWINFDANTRTISGTPTVSDTDIYEIKITATDKSNASVADTFIINVKYQAPVITSFPITQIFEDSTYNYNVTFSDPLGTDSSIVEITNDALWLSVNDIDLSGTPTNEEVGTYNVSVKISNKYHSTTQNFEIEVINTNDAPILTQTIDDVSFEAEYLFSYDLPTNLFTDVDLNDSLTYSVQVNGSNDLPSWLTFNNETLSFEGYPYRADTGTYNIKIIATDIAGDTASDNFDMKIYFHFGTSGISNINNLEVALYPNPSIGFINLDFNNVNQKEINIFNLKGEKVFTDKTNLSIKTYNLENLVSGIYFVQIKQGNSITAKKLIIR